jgi:hypothetical protein
MIFADNGTAAVIVILNGPDEAVILKNRYGPIGRMPIETIAAFFSTVETNYPESRPVLYEIVPGEDLGGRPCPGLQMGPEAGHGEVHRGGCCSRWAASKECSPSVTPSSPEAER